uniref:Uncharacterized protein n=1 Tax=Crocodylus porosus TaxID=8502 RepID=A0A7M4E7W3_CROPO
MAVRSIKSMKKSPTDSEATSLVLVSRLELGCAEFWDIWSSRPGLEEFHAHCVGSDGSMEPGIDAHRTSPHRSITHPILGPQKVIRENQPSTSKQPQPMESHPHCLLYQQQGPKGQVHMVRLSMPSSAFGSDWPSSSLAASNLASLCAPCSTVLKWVRCSSPGKPCGCRWSTAQTKEPSLVCSPCYLLFVSSLFSKQNLAPRKECNYALITMSNKSSVTGRIWGSC